MDQDCVYCAIQTEYLNKIHFLVLRGLIEINFSLLSYPNQFYTSGVCFYINRIPPHVIGHHEPMKCQKKLPNLSNYGNIFDVNTPIFSKCCAGIQHIPFSAHIFDHQQN